MVEGRIGGRVTPLPSPPLGKGTPIKDLERLWLDTSCAYACLDETMMADEDWDQMTKELWDRRSEWSPYFKEAVPASCVESSTASGVNWDEGLPQIVLTGLKEDMPTRMRLWRLRLGRIEKEIACPGHQWHRGYCSLCGADEVYTTGIRSQGPRDSQKK